MSLSDFISIISVIIAVVSTVIAAVAIKSANTINNKEIILQNYEDMRDWFEEMVFMMKDLYLRYPDNKKKDELKESLVRFSTYIDLGRIFFKNQQMGEYKINKPEVFRGRRVILLDVIVLYYNIYKLGLQAENQEMLWGLQRAFISEMITLLNQNKFSKKYVEYTFIDEKNIIDIDNINNQEFRDVLLSADIIKAVKEQTINIESQHSKKKKSTKNSKKANK